MYNIVLPFSAYPQRCFLKALFRHVTARTIIPITMNMPIIPNNNMNNDCVIMIFFSFAPTIYLATRLNKSPPIITLAICPPTFTPAACMSK